MWRSIPVLLCSVWTAATAQQPARDAYLDLLPPMPKLMAQTEASVHFALYGDRHAASYADLNVNGIDDGREALLLDVADRFSPVLRRNNFSVPLNFMRVLGERAAIQVDDWDKGRLVRSQEVELTEAAVKGSSDAVSSALATLVQAYLPSKAEHKFIKPEDYTTRVLFIDFPGSDPKSWRKAYQNTPIDEATSYVHFFIHDEAESGKESGYYLVAQYWFFYPFNDAANNHEGDWERINVAVTLDSAVLRDDSRLSSNELRRVLSGEIPVDRLSIAFVDYFFHESAITLDYRHAYAKETHRKLSVLERIAVWRDTSFMARVVRDRVSVGNGVLATHPVGFIGGNNKGPDELLSIWPRFRASYNRNSHGTYPFPGIWQSVGPLGSTEHVPGRPVPRLPGGPIERDEVARLLAQDGFVMFKRSNLILVPDWERVEPLIESNAQAQHNWSWLVLPLRWGFPAAASPGAGAIKHVDVGNIAPEGPAFQPGWNRVGSAGWRVYQPDVLRALLPPSSPFDKMTSGWGFLNLPVAVIGFLPGWNVAATQLMPWLTGTASVFHSTLPRTFRPRSELNRFTSISLGTFHQSGGNDFALLLPRSAAAASAAPSENESDLRFPRSSMTRTSNHGLRIGMEVHYGKRLSVENTFAVADARIATRVEQSGGNDIGTMSAQIKTRDLTGGLRYNVLTSPGGAWHSFLKGGYGWSWYSVDDLQINGTGTDYRANSGYAVTLLPSRKWWPNAWYAGAGIEVFSPRRGWLLQQFGYGLRAEYTTLQHRLGARSPGAESLGFVQRNDFSVYAIIGW